MDALARLPLGASDAAVSGHADHGPDARVGRRQFGGGDYDLIVCATGVLEVDGVAPEKTIAAVDGDVMLRQLAVNTVGPTLLLKHLHASLARKRRSVFAVLSARVGSIEDNQLGGWLSYRTAKAALNQAMRTSAVEIARVRPDACVVSLHPGTVTTEMTRKYVGAVSTDKQTGARTRAAAGTAVLSPDECAERLLAVMDSLSAPRDTGGFFDWRGDRLPF